MQDDGQAIGEMDPLDILVVVDALAKATTIEVVVLGGLAPRAQFVTTSIPIRRQQRLGVGCDASNPVK